MPKRKVAKHRVNIDGGYYPYDDATEDVKIQRELVDIWNAQPGKADACMNHHCIIRNRDSFPHPVIAASVIKTRVYIFDSPDHVVRYIMSAKDAELVGHHDTLKIGETGTLVLHAPVGKEVGGSHHDRPGRPRGKNTGTRGKGLARGERARIAAAVGAVPS